MPAFAHWPGQVAAHTCSAEVVSTMDLLPSLVRLAKGGRPLLQSGRVLDGEDSLYDILLREDGKSKHTFLPFYNNPAIANASTTIFAARYGPFKVIQSRPLTPQLYLPSPL